MGYHDEDYEEESNYLEEEEEIQELEIDEGTGRLKRGPVANPEPDFYEQEEMDDETEVEPYPE